MIMWLMTNITLGVILYEFLNYHISCEFPVCEIRFLANRKFVEGRILSLSGVPLVALPTEAKVCREEDRFRHNVCC